MCLKSGPTQRQLIVTTAPIFSGASQKLVSSKLVNTPGRGQSKKPILSMNVDQKSIETVFSIAICRPTGDKCQSKTLFISIFYPHLSIVDNVFDCLLPRVVNNYSTAIKSVQIMFQRTLPS